MVTGAYADQTVDQSMARRKTGRNKPFFMNTFYLILHYVMEELQVRV
jgi:hypothetical protein